MFITSRGKTNSDIFFKTICNDLMNDTHNLYKIYTPSLAIRNRETRIQDHEIGDNAIKKSRLGQMINVIIVTNGHIMAYDHPKTFLLMAL